MLTIMTQYEQWPGGDGSRQPMDTTQLAQKEMMGTEQALEFVRGAKFRPTEVSQWQARCVDGRYNGEAASAARSMPGGDAGMLMVGIAAIRDLKNESLLPRERVRVDKALKDLLKSHGVKFAMHTDDHHEDDGHNPACGCGHCNNAFADPSSYGLGPRDTLHIQTKLSELDEDDKAELTELEGQHDERAVIVVRGNWGVLSKAHVQGEERQAFVLQQDFQDAALDEFAQRLAVKFDLDEETVRQKVREVAAKQLLETLGRIAKGVPIFEVEIDDEGEVALRQAA